MIDYNPKSWWKLIFIFHKSDSFTILSKAILGITVYTAAIVYIANDILHMVPANLSPIHSMVGFALSLLLVFRTNSAYDRWWEGRKLWGGLVNSSRNLALKLSTMVDDESVKKTFSALIANYAFATKEHLRGRYLPEELEDNATYPLAKIDPNQHVPNQIMKNIFTEIETNKKRGLITEQQQWLINNELQSFTDMVGACERILRTPIPYSYSMFLKKVIFIYTFTLPFGFIVDYRYWAILIVVLVFYVFASLEVIAEEIEEPFGTDSNDLPLDRICQTIKKDVTYVFSTP